MKRKILIVGLILITIFGSFIGGGWFFTKRLLSEVNGIASDNFSFAIASFRDSYQAKRIQIWGEVEGSSAFTIGDYNFVVNPTIPEHSPESFNPEYCNMAAHTNGMVVMLACTWIINGDPRGDELLLKLKDVIPNFELSAPDIDNVKVSDLTKGSSMMKSEAGQWDWRMDSQPK